MNRQTVVATHAPPGEVMLLVKLCCMHTCSSSITEHVGALLLAASRHRNEAHMSALRPPALVTEYLASGSLRAALARKADFVTHDSVKIKLALDAARVSISLREGV